MALIKLHAQEPIKFLHAQETSMWAAAHGQTIRAAMSHYRLLAQDVEARRKCFAKASGMRAMTCFAADLASTYQSQWSCAPKRIE
jgi:hypothetical protein